MMRRQTDTPTASGRPYPRERIIGRYSDVSFRVNLANEPSTTVSAPLDSGTEYHMAVEFNSVVLIPVGLASGSP